MHNYCGRTHALEHCNGQVKPPHGICHTCKLPGCDEPVYFEEEQNRVHDFCCLSHAQLAMERGIWPKSLKRVQVAGGDASSASMICSLPGCSAPRFRDPESGELKDFCGRSHAIKAREQGMVGRSMTLDDGGVDRVFQTSSRVSGESGTVSMMTRRHRKYEAVKQQFLEAWRHPEKPKPTIMRIYQVLFSILFLCIVGYLTTDSQVRNAPSVYQAYLDYREGLEQQCDFESQVRRHPCRGAGNHQFTAHGGRESSRATRSVAFTGLCSALGAGLSPLPGFAFAIP